MTWREELVTLIAHEARPVHKIGHQARLYALTVEIAAGFDLPRAYDDDVVFAAAFLHDLGVFVGHRPEDRAALAQWDHVSYAAERAPEILASIGFPLEKVAAVVACIREHQPQDEPQTLEAALLRDADILEQLGAIAVFRTASKLGTDTRFATFTEARNALRKAAEELPEKLLLRAARPLAAPKIAMLVTFLDALDAEAQGYLG
jgi:uncharacterized protein